MSKGIEGKSKKIGKRGRAEEEETELRERDEREG